MTNETHSESELGEVNFPGELLITVESGEEAFDKAVEAAGSAERGEQSSAVVSVGTLEDFREFLDDRRLELLESLMEKPTTDISSLAERLGRDRSTVERDVELFSKFGIVQSAQESEGGKVYIPYDTLEFSITVQADNH